MIIFIFSVLIGKQTLLTKILGTIKKHKKGDFVEFPDVSLVKDKRIHAVLTEEGIQSLISIPMMDGDVAIGFIGFDIMKTKREFNSNEKNTQCKKGFRSDQYLS